MDLLNLPIDNLVDVRRALQSLDDIKDNFSKFDLKLSPIEDAFKVGTCPAGEHMCMVRDVRENTMGDAFKVGPCPAEEHRCMVRDVRESPIEDAFKVGPCPAGEYVAAAMSR